MSATQTQTVNSKVEQVDVNLDEIFNAAPSGADMIQDTKAKPKSIFSRGEKADMSFADPDMFPARTCRIRNHRASGNYVYPASMLPQISCLKQFDKQGRTSR